MQTLCGLQGIFDLFNCKTPVQHGTLTITTEADLFKADIMLPKLEIPAGGADQIQRYLPDRVIQLLYSPLASIIIPSLTVERVKRGYKPSKYGRCSLFRSCIDMCYILSLSKTFVFLMRVRMEVLVMIS